MRLRRPTDQEIAWWCEGARRRSAGRPKPQYPDNCSELEEARIWWVRQGWDSTRPGEVTILDED